MAKARGSEERGIQVDHSKSIEVDGMSSVRKYRLKMGSIFRIYTRLLIVGKYFKRSLKNCQ